MSDYSIRNSSASIVYVLIVGIIAFVLFFISIIVSTLSIGYLTLPSESIATTGFVSTQGLSSWFVALYDHALRILILAVSFSIFSSISISLFKQVPIEKLRITIQTICAIILVLGMGWQFLNPEKYTQEDIPTIDTIIAIILFACLCFFTIRRYEEFSKFKGLICILGIILAIVACAAILYITLLIAMFVHVISVLIDVWTYIDLTLGSEWRILHIILTIVSHIQNIILFGAAFLIGIFACYKVIAYLVPIKMPARFLQSAVSLWSLEFLLYAVTDEKSMKGAMFDTFDFCVMIVLFALLSLVALLGMFEFVNDD